MADDLKCPTCGGPVEIILQPEISMPVEPTLAPDIVRVVTPALVTWRCLLGGCERP